MITDKYTELQSAAATHHRHFVEYEERCRHFIATFRDAVASFYGVGNDQVLWVTHNDDDDDDLVYSVDRRMARLPHSSVYQFILKLLVQLPDSVFPFSYELMWRLSWNEKRGYTLTVGDNIIKIENDLSDIEEAVQEFHDTLLTFFHNDFEQFLNGRPRPLGFRLPPEQQSA